MRLVARASGLGVAGAGGQLGHFLVRLRDTVAMAACSHAGLGLREVCKSDAPSSALPFTCMHLRSAQQWPLHTHLVCSERLMAKQPYSAAGMETAPPAALHWHCNPDEPSSTAVLLGSRAFGAAVGPESGVETLTYKPIQTWDFTSSSRSLSVTISCV